MICCMRLKICRDTFPFLITIKKDSCCWCHIADGLTNLRCHTAPLAYKLASFGGVGGSRTRVRNPYMGGTFLRNSQFFQPLPCGERLRRTDSALLRAHRSDAPPPPCFAAVTRKSAIPVIPSSADAYPTGGASFWHPAAIRRQLSPCKAR